MIEKTANILTIIGISLLVMVSYDLYKDKYMQKEEAIIVFSSKKIIEHKKLQIKKALLSGGNIEQKENELIKTIKTIDEILSELSKEMNKPIYKKEAILTGQLKDITPIVEAKLKRRGLFQ